MVLFIHFKISKVFNNIFIPFFFNFILCFPDNLNNNWEFLPSMYKLHPICYQKTCTKLKIKSFLRLQKAITDGNKKHDCKINI